MAIINKPTDYFNTKLYTGNGGTQSITGVEFQPDWTWLKDRTTAEASHKLYDSVRGATKYIASNNTGAEATDSNGLTAFGTDGFTLGSTGGTNGNGITFVSWNWKAGTTVSGATTGSGTAKTYTGSVNTTSGFSIVKYTGNGTAGHTIPHNLSAVPKTIIIKSFGGNDWVSHHAPLGNVDTLRLNETGAKVSSSTSFNSTTPSSTVFTVGTDSKTNTNDGTYIAYCFSDITGFSKMGLYVGNGSTDGTFVYTGFKPAFVMIKASSAVKDWKMIDDKRNPAGLGGANPVRYRLAANTNGPRSDDGDGQDFTSQGFKFRTTDSHMNGSGTTYIYMAFAENPFVSNTASGSVPVTAR